MDLGWGGLQITSDQTQKHIFLLFYCLLSWLKDVELKTLNIVPRL